MTTQHRSQATTGTHVQQPHPHSQTSVGAVTVSRQVRMKVKSPLLTRSEVAKIFGVTKRTISNWEGNRLIVERNGRTVRYPADKNGLTGYIEVVQQGIAKEQTATSNDTATTAKDPSIAKDKYNP